MRASEKEAGLVEDEAIIEVKGMNTSSQQQ